MPRSSFDIQIILWGNNERSRVIAPEQVSRGGISRFLSIQCGMFFKFLARLIRESDRIAHVAVDGDDKFDTSILYKFLAYSSRKLLCVTAKNISS